MSRKSVLFCFAAMASAGAATYVLVVGSFPLTTCSALAEAQTPQGWSVAGSHPQAYEMSVDRSVAHSGECSAYLKSIEPTIDGFGTLMQSFQADRYQGKRVRMSGYVKSENVKGWAGLWMRVDGPERGRFLAFDNMQNRAIKGTTDWTKYAVVLDVAENATAIAIGILLNGTGRAWIDDLTFETVGKDVPTTDTYGSAKLSPANLDFEGLK